MDKTTSVVWGFFSCFFFFAMPRSKLLSSGRRSPSGIGGDLSIIIDKTLIISRVIDSGLHDIFMLIYDFVDKSLDLSSDPNTAHSSA